MFFSTSLNNEVISLIFYLINKGEFINLFCVKKYSRKQNFTAITIENKLMNEMLYES